MFDDPIVAEVRKTREKLLEEAGGYDAYVQKLKAMEEKHSERLVTRRPAPRETHPEAAEV